MNKGAETGPTGMIGRTIEDGLPVIWRFTNELPGASVRTRLPWLAVISWKYDGTERNGMPSEPTNERMLALERALEKLEAPEQCVAVYRRTGNHLKELVYQVHDRDVFVAGLNSVLAGQERYPIEIRFYEDPEWSDFRRLLADFAGAGDQAHG